MPESNAVCVALSFFFTIAQSALLRVALIWGARVQDCLPAAIL